MKIVIVGVGLIGYIIVYMLCEMGDYEVVVFDCDVDVFVKLLCEGIVM